MFLNIVQLAESLGVEESEVESWVRNDGLPHVTDRKRLLFDRVQVVDWASSRGLVAQCGFLAPERVNAPDEMHLETMLHTGGIWRDIPAAGVAALFAKIIAKLPGTTPSVRQMLQQRLRVPDGISWALVGNGFALPHPRTRIALGRDAGIFAIVLLHDALAVNEPAPDEQPVTRLLFFVAPSPRSHLEILARLSIALTRGTLRQLINEGVSDDKIFAAVAVAEKLDKKEGDA
jgi:PTS system nitrogen regulatory IIA component